MADRFPDGELRLEQLTAADVSAFMLAQAGWRMPGALSTTVTGLRALLRFLYLRGYTPLARLGLRAGEVAGLCLEDIDWRAGELVVRGKGSHGRLPLPFDVGRALADYLRQRRPVGDSRNVFLQASAPHSPLGRCGVSHVLQHACRRAGVNEVGAHRLRHSAAMQMHRAGAGLIEIGQVLRHRHMFTTTIYARADTDALIELARPLPGEGSAR